MTISTQTRTAGPFIGTGLVVGYPFTFKVFQTSDVLVVVQDTSGVQSTLTIGTDYTVVLNADQNAAPGGTVTPLVALTVGYSLTLTSNVPVTQNASLTNAGGFFPKTIEDALDRLTILMQQQGFVSSGQTLRVPEIGGVPLLSTAAQRANNLLGFDSSGNPVAVAPVSGSAVSLATDLTNNTLSAKGAGQVGFDYAPAYAALSSGWGTRLANRGYNMLRQVTPSLWAAILNGTSTDNHSAAIVAGVAAATAAGLQPYFPGKKWNYTPTTFLEFPYGFTGDDASLTAIYVDASAYAIGSVVWRVTGGTFGNLTLREKTLDKTRAVMLQVAGATAVNAAGGGTGATFTAYADGTRCWVFGGLITFDVGNMFTCAFRGCRFNQGGTGVNIVPNPAAGGGYFNTLIFDGCEIADNNKNWNVNPSVGSHGLTIRGGSTERCLTTAAFFQNVTNLSYWDHYMEQAVALSPAIIIQGSQVYARLTHSGANCDIQLGSNTTIEIEGWDSGVNHLLGADGTQTVTIKGCTFPAAGNSVPGNFASFTAEGSVYNGVTFNYRPDSIAVSKAYGTAQAAPTIASASTIAPVNPIVFVSGTAAIQNITPPPAFALGGGQITLIPTGLFTINNAGNVQIASTAVVSKALIMTYDVNTARWYPSY